MALTSEETQMLVNTDSTKYPNHLNGVAEKIASGLTPVCSKPDLLTLDLDSEGEIAVYRIRLEKFKELFAVEKIIEIESPSGRGLHVYLKLYRDFSIPERLAREALMGSDPVRGILGLARFLNGERTGATDDYTRNPSFLFEREPGLVKFDKPVEVW